MKKWLITLLVLSAALTGCTQAAEDKTAEEKATLQEKEYAVNVTEIGEAEFVDSAELSGQLSPYNEAYVSAKTGGEIDTISGMLGDEVIANAVLMTLDDEVYRLGKNKAALGVENASASYKNALDGYKRSKLLYDTGGLSQSELDQIKLQLDMAELGLKNAKLDLESAQLNFNYTKITAPIAGVIAEQNGSVGENIGQGQSLFRIVDISNFYVEVGVSENIITKLSVGQVVKCTTSDGTVFDGLVENVSPVMNDQSKTYPVKIKLQNKGNTLRSGMSITASVQLKEPYIALSVPKEAIVVIGDKRFVFVVESDRAEQREVILASTNNESFEVVSGLQKGEKIIVSGPGLLKQGDKVKVIQE